MCKYIVTLSVIYFFISAAFCFNNSPGVMDKIKSGFQLAGKFLGLDHASGVAQLVADTFGKTAYKGESNEQNVFSGFLRVFGFGTKKIGAIAVNALIFIAQLISTSLSKPPPSQLTVARKLSEGTPFEWVMNNNRITNLIDKAKNDNLPHSIIEHIKENSLDEDTGCIQLLICKTAPFVWSMQKALNTKNITKGHKILYTYLPSMDEFTDEARKCEEKHKYCLIHF